MMIEILNFLYILDCELILAELHWMIEWHGSNLVVHVFLYVLEDK